MAVQEQVHLGGRDEERKTAKLGLRLFSMGLNWADQPSLDLTQQYSSSWPQRGILAVPSSLANFLKTKTRRIAPPARPNIKHTLLCKIEGFLPQLREPNLCMHAMRLIAVTKQKTNTSREGWHQKDSQPEILISAGLPDKTLFVRNFYRGPQNQTCI